MADTPSPSDAMVGFVLAGDSGSILAAVAKMAAAGTTNLEIAAALVPASAVPTVSLDVKGRAARHAALLARHKLCVAAGENPQPSPETPRPPHPLAVCGYRGSGKDHLGRQLSGAADAPEFDWEVFGRPGEKNPFDASTQGVFAAPAPRARLACADALKAEVAARWGVPADSEKNMLVPGSEAGGGEDLAGSEAGGGRTFRDLLISTAAEARAADPDCWVRRVHEDYLAAGGPDFILTDWRFPNELEFLIARGLDPVTVRVFSAAAAAEVDAAGRPPSETALDAIATDWLLVREGDESGARARFPQYSEFERVPNEH